MFYSPLTSCVRVAHVKRATGRLSRKSEDVVSLMNGLLCLIAWVLVACCATIPVSYGVDGQYLVSFSQRLTGQNKLYIYMSDARYL